MSADGVNGLSIVEAIEILTQLESKNPGARLHVITCKGKFWKFGFAAVEMTPRHTIKTLEEWKPADVEEEADDAKQRS